MNIIFSPHLDDELIGCYSILDTINAVVHFTDDYRIKDIRSREWAGLPTPYSGINFVFWSPDCIYWGEDDTIYLPSKYDYHPLHRKVRQIGLTLPGKKMFYSVEMNTPWLEEESDPVGKRKLFEAMYPGEIETISKSDKYFLFKSIKPFDSIIWASMKFERELYHRWPSAPDEVSFLKNLHRHKFYFQVEIQQFADNRDLEYFITSRNIQAWFDKQTWAESTSCEMFALAIETWLTSEYPDRLLRVRVMEDNENGALVE